MGSAAEAAAATHTGRHDDHARSPDSARSADGSYHTGARLYPRAARAWVRHPCHADATGSQRGDTRATQADDVRDSESTSGRIAEAQAARVEHPSPRGTRVARPARQDCCRAGPSQRQHHAAVAASQWRRSRRLCATRDVGPPTAPYTAGCKRSNAAASLGWPIFGKRQAEDCAKQPAHASKGRLSSRGQGHAAGFSRR